LQTNYLVALYEVMKLVLI